MIIVFIMLSFVVSMIIGLIIGLYIAKINNERDTDDYEDN